VLWWTGPSEDHRLDDRSAVEALNRLDAGRWEVVAVTESVGSSLLTTGTPVTKYLLKRRIDNSRSGPEPPAAG
jgi:hypothetical protein